MVKKEISNNVLAGLMIVVVVLSVVSTTLLWVMSDTDEASETVAITEDSGTAQVSITIDELSNNSDGADGGGE